MNSEPHFPTAKLHEDLDIDWIDVSMQRTTCVDIYKCLNVLNPVNMCNHIKPIEQQCYLRSNTNLNIQNLVHIRS